MLPAEDVPHPFVAVTLTVHVVWLVTTGAVYVTHDPVPLMLPHDGVPQFQLVGFPVAVAHNCVVAPEQRGEGGLAAITGVPGLGLIVN